MSCSGWPSLTRYHPCCYSLLPTRIQRAKRKGRVVPERTIFRQSAIEAYKRGREKDVVPRLISWPIIVCFWLLLVVFIAAGFLAWDVQVPTYVDGSGIILEHGAVPQSEYGEMMSVVFLPADKSAHIRVGL